MADELTIAVPFHSRLDYLRLAIESVLGQKDGAWQLLIVDDGEREQGARELAHALGDSRVRYLRNPRNLGMAPCWNRCIDEARTDLVALLHADDLLLDGYVALARRLAAAHPHAVATFCGAAIIDAAGRARRSFQDDVKRIFVPRNRMFQDGAADGRAGGDLVLRGEPALRALLRGNFIMCPTLCFRRSLLGELRFATDWRQAQDLELTSRLLFAGHTLVGSRAKGYAYRRHEGSATAGQTESLLRFAEEYRLFDSIAERARALGWSRAERTARRKTIVKLHLSYRLVRELARGRLRAARRIGRFLFTGGRARD